MLRSCLYLILLLVSTAFSPMSNSLHAQLAIPYSLLVDVFENEAWTTQLAFEKAGRPAAIYLKLDRQFELLQYPRPDTSRCQLYAYWPEELFYYNIRYWVEITSVRQIDQQLEIAFQSRGLSDQKRIPQVGKLVFVRALDGWKLQLAEIYPLD